LISQEWLLIEMAEGEAEPTNIGCRRCQPISAFRQLVDFAKLRWAYRAVLSGTQAEVGLDIYEGADARLPSSTTMSSATARFSERE